jgi:hypothetical protein
MLGPVLVPKGLVQSDEDTNTAKGSGLFWCPVGGGVIVVRVGGEPYPSTSPRRPKDHDNYAIMGLLKAYRPNMNRFKPSKWTRFCERYQGAEKICSLIDEY